MRNLPPLSFVALAALTSVSCHHASLAPAPAPALAHAPAPAPPLAPALAPAQIDAALRAEWSAAGIAPSARADDARFLRRAYVDIVGTIPPPDAVSAFLDDASPDKRAKLVDALLASPAYADHWAAYWDEALMGRFARDPNVDRAAFRAWARDRIAKNEPYDRFAAALISATGENRGDDDADGSDLTADANVNGAVNWLLRYGNSPQDLAGTASRVFLGVQIQCAQCHDHKTEKWKKTDFERFAASFVRIQIRPIDKGPAMGKTKRVEVREAKRAVPRFTKNPENQSIVSAAPTALDGTDLASADDPRAALGAWIASDKNPWFARALVNRMWGHFLGRGFVDPIDDLRDSNPPAAPALFDALAKDFAAHGYDVKRLIRSIAATEAYQLSAAPPSSPAKSEIEHKLWARFRVAPLDADELIHALMAATDLEDALKKKNVDLDKTRVQIGRAYGFLFDTDEAMDRDDFEGTIAQALALLNGSLVGTGSSAIRGGALASVLAAGDGNAAKKSDDAVIDALYLRTLSRYPTGDERAYWRNYVVDALAAPPVLRAKAMMKSDPLRRFEAQNAATDPRTQAFEDLFWALLNSSEFVLNH